MPTLTELYRDIAERHLLAARLLLAEGLHDVSIFHAYHSLESIACSAIAVRGLPVPWNHQSKLETFLHLYRSQPFSHGARTLAAALMPMRNRVLYPVSGEALPREAVTKDEAGRFLARVEGLIPLVQRATSA